MTKRNGHGQSPTASQPIKPGRLHKQNQASKVRASGVSLSSPGSSIPHGPRRDELPKLLDPAVRIVTNDAESVYAAIDRDRGAGGY